MNRIVLVAALVGGLMTSQTRAGDPASAAKHAEAVTNLATAANLASYGRGDLGDLTGLKGAKSPEALVAAGGILLRAGAALGTNPVAIDENGEPDPKAKVRTFADQANDLFDEALGMAGNDKTKQAAIQKLIQQAKTLPMGETRGAVGKPRTVTRVVKPGETIEIKIGFVPNAPATVNYESAGGPRQRCEILGPNGNTLYDNTGKSGSHSWTTARGDDKKRMVTIRLTNTGNQAHAVTVTTN